MNSRKAARTIPSTISRLLKSQAFLKSPPAAFEALLSHPPPPSLVRTLPSRPIDDLPRLHRGRPSNASSTKGDAHGVEPQEAHTNRTPPRRPNTKHAKPLPIVFPEDRIRRQFFLDHPFEAYRPKDLNELETVQNAAHGPQGKAWTELRQRSIVPGPDDVIAFTLNLTQAHSIPPSKAYAHALSQYRTLKAEHETATSAAVDEARAHGAHFFGEVERGLVSEERALDEWKDAKTIQEQLLAQASARGRGGNAAVAAASASSSATTVDNRAERMPWSGAVGFNRIEEQPNSKYELTGGDRYLERFEARFLNQAALAAQEAKQGSER
ncbi:BQ2448_85 [Microbotryum intermedium]|uniref:Small ribosomal subunit protein mS23 n=1 Tax=Microbotryum intermedium TaxID=269621 RepID=A0A238F7W7_9BASI|nr:BQ2448_85 [Microbotryum intermedium]